MAARKNWPTEVKLDIILTVLRGEATAAELARRHGINEGTISRWREQFLAGGEAALTTRAADSEKAQLKNERLKKLLGEKVVELDILRSCSYAGMCIRG